MGAKRPPPFTILPILPMHTIPSSISHIQTEGILQCFDRSAVNDVRVTSCSPVFGQKYVCAGIVVTNTVLRIEPICFQQKMNIEHGYQTAILDFQFFENFEINGTNNHQKLLFPKIFREILRLFKNRNICKRTLVDE